MAHTYDNEDTCTSKIMKMISNFQRMLNYLKEARSEHHFYHGNRIKIMAENNILTLVKKFCSTVFSKIILVS